MDYHNKNIMYNGKFLSVIKRDGWEYVQRNTNTGDVVSITAITKDNEIILVEQYRIPVDCYVIENPAGLLGDINKNETPIECAKKELLEETGYISNNWEYVFTTPKSPGLISECSIHFIARDCEKIEDGGGVDNEKILVHKVQLDNIRNYFKELKDNNILVSSGIYAGLYFI